ncbi:MAG TPA: metallothionein [Candidatus Binatia bacterium]
MAEEKCAHKACDCAIDAASGVKRGDQVYCSPVCANAALSGGSSTCGCGHSACRQNHARV